MKRSSIRSGDRRSSEQNNGMDEIKEMQIYFKSHVLKVSQEKKFKKDEIKQTIEKKAEVKIKQM